MYRDPFHLLFIRANQWMHAVELQSSRIIGPITDLEKDGLVKYRMVWNQKQRDIDFFLISLNRLRTAISSANRKINSEEISKALEKFDMRIPDVKDLRDISEHFDDYDNGNGRLQKQNKLLNTSPSMGWGEEDASMNYGGRRITIISARNSARRLHDIVMRVLEENNVQIILDEWPLVHYLKSESLELNS